MRPELMPQSAVMTPHEEQVATWLLHHMTNTSDYDYELPRELIAQEPLPNRGDARLMVVDRRRQEIRHEHVRDLPDFLQSTDCLVLNNTKVIPARLVGRRTATGGRWQGLFLEADARGVWRVLGKTRGHLQPGESVTLLDEQAEPVFELRMVTKLDGGQWAAKPECDGEPLALLERVGRVPLPQYIRGGEMLPADRQRYQTVFANVPGSVAAPTAGLHFSQKVLAELDAQQIARAYVTLHVGIGTFRPIAADQIEDHVMHSEYGELSEETVKVLQRVRSTGGRVVAVGTTSMRVLESVTRSGPLRSWSGATDLYIRPGFEFRVVDCLMTNFHLPRSSLLVLVRTFGGNELMRHAYQVAIDEGYRFYSYGDAMLIV
jgi:S-adenosylmethionine:tRNA ribosyltransferase-isomerase